MDYETELRARKYGHSLSITESISHAACSTAMDIDAKAIVTVTKTGFTARNLSKYRPNMPIIGCSDTEKSCRQLALSWGVVPLLMKSVTSTDELIELSIAAAVKENLIKEGDMVVVTAGVPVGVAGSTNIIKAQEVGKICLGNLKL